MSAGSAGDKRHLNHLFYHNKRLLFLAIALIVVSGLGAYQALPRIEDPRLTSRFAMIETYYPGATAERVEALITNKIEEELGDIDEISDIWSDTRAGVSMIELELYDDTPPGDVARIWTKVRNRLDNVEPEFPAGATKPDLDDEQTTAADTIIVALAWESAAPVSPNIMERYAEELEDRFRALPGTEKTDVLGTTREELRVEFDSDRFTSLGLTPQQVAAILQRSDAKSPAGRLRGEGSEMLIEVSGELDSVERLRRTPIVLGPNEIVELGDLANVYKGTADPPAEIALVSGRRALTVSAVMGPGYRVDQWAGMAHRMLDEFEAELPRGIAMDRIYDQSKYMEARLDGLQGSLLLGGCFVLLVIFFLMGWRSAILVGSALPFTVFIVLTAMRLLGIPIHQMTVTGLIIALGLLIDNAIVMVDEVNRGLRKGEDPSAAISLAVQHLFVPLLGSTLTTVLAFMPIVLLPGGAGEFVGPISQTVILALFASFGLAMTILPALAGLFRSAQRDDGKRVWWRQGYVNPTLLANYRRLLDTTLRRPAIPLIVIPVIAFSGLALVPTLDEQFFPPVDRDQFQLQLTFPSHTPIKETLAKVQSARAMLLEHPRVVDVHWWLAAPAPRVYYNMIGGLNGSPSYAGGLIQLDSSDDYQAAVRDVQAMMQTAFPEAVAIALQFEQGPPFDAPIEIEIQGPDLDELRRHGDELRRIMASVPDVVATRTTIEDGRPKLWYRVDEAEARMAGLSNVGIAQELEAVLEGAVGGSIIEGTEELPVRVRIKDAGRREVDQIASIDLLGSDGGNSRVPLTALGKLELIPERGRISHTNGIRANTIQGFITAGVLPSTVVARIETAMVEAEFTLPPGYTSSLGGEADERNEAVGSLIAPAAVLLIMMITTLVLALSSFRLMAIIGAIGFMSVGFGMIALKVFGLPFGFMAIVGTMGLIGVAINDSIVVVAAIDANEDARHGDTDAIREVVIGATRHVVATTLTTIAGFIPLVLSGGMWPQLAMPIAGGVGGATLMAVLFAPPAYLVLKGRRDGRKAQAVAVKSTNGTAPSPFQQPSATQPAATSTS